MSFPIPSVCSCYLYSSLRASRICRSAIDAQRHRALCPPAEALPRALPKNATPATARRQAVHPSAIDLPLLTGTWCAAAHLLEASGDHHFQPEVTPAGGAGNACLWPRRGRRAIMRRSQPLCGQRDFSAATSAIPSARPCIASSGQREVGWLLSSLVSALIEQRSESHARNTP